MPHILDRSIADVAEALRAREVSATELAEEAVRRHTERGAASHAYKFFDADGARAAARQADERLASDTAAPPMCGIPVSVKDLYGVEGQPTFAGTARRLPDDAWARDGRLVSALRAQGAVLVGKTHTVELAFGAVGVNPHWGTPRNPWDAQRKRIPGGSSCGAGVSLWEGSALVALGSDTGGSIRIPASMTGTVGHKTTFGRWPVDGVVPLSHTLDSVGALTRTVEDSIYFFGSVDPTWDGPQALLWQLAPLAQAGLRMAVPRCGIWDDCAGEITTVLESAIHELSAFGWQHFESDGHLLDDAHDLYMGGGIAGAECKAFLNRDLPEWIDLLDPTVGTRISGAPDVESNQYRGALEDRARLLRQVDDLFEGADVLALPSAIMTPVTVEEVGDFSRYVEVNKAALRPTCPASMLGLCAISIPVGLDDAGMPVGLQLLAPGGSDEPLLGAALAVERALGTGRQRMGDPPGHA